MHGRDRVEMARVAAGLDRREVDGRQTLGAELGQMETIRTEVGEVEKRRVVDQRPDVQLRLLLSECHQCVVEGDQVLTKQRLRWQELLVDWSPNS